FQALHEHIYQHVNGVISSDFDYYLPLKGHPKHLGLIPHPIDVDQIQFNPLKISDKIVIFHGINRNNYCKKGNDIFEAALDQIRLIFGDKIEIITAENLPYSEYIHAFDSAHILLDQIFAYDQGYNALEAMAKGKVVFTGAEREWLEHYGLEEDAVAINALPDVDAIVEKLTYLIEHPEKLEDISKRARSFVEAQHHYIKCAERYLEFWNAN
ncbi:MAG: glycosyltransferase family 1 protein, partial [Psychroserpens sp.]|nr:glycosyltransferase family 1 protein [Psychroserpens sp.]